jgi:hypothetical protein
MLLLELALAQAQERPQALPRGGQGARSASRGPGARPPVGARRPGGRIHGAGEHGAGQVAAQRDRHAAAAGEASRRLRRGAESEREGGRMAFTSGLAECSLPQAQTKQQAYSPYTGCLPDAWLMHAGAT